MRNTPIKSGRLGFDSPREYEVLCVDDDSDDEEKEKEQEKKDDRDHNRAQQLCVKYVHEIGKRKFICKICCKLLSTLGIMQAHMNIVHIHLSDEEIELQSLQFDETAHPYSTEELLSLPSQQEKRKKRIKENRNRVKKTHKLTGKKSKRSKKVFDDYEDDNDEDNVEEEEGEEDEEYEDIADNRIMKQPSRQAAIHGIAKRRSTLNERLDILSPEEKELKRNRIAKALDEKRKTKEEEEKRILEETTEEMDTSNQSEYEAIRQENIRRNNAVMRSLGLIS